MIKISLVIISYFLLLNFKFAIINKYLLIDTFISAILRKRNNYN